MTIAFRPLRNPNPLVFPAGARPGFDPAHLAAAPVTLSYIQNGRNNTFSVLAGQPGAITGSPTSATIGILGPAVNFPNASGDNSQYTGQGTSSHVGVTAAGIVQLTANSGGLQTVIMVRDNGPDLLFNNLELRLLLGGQVASGISVVINTPYFVAASCNDAGGSGTVNFVFTNLSTGAITSASVGNGGQNSGVRSGTVTIGANTSVQELQGYLAAAMFSQTYLTLIQLKAWAADPWSFWYPRRDTVLVGAAAAAFKAYWAAQNNMPVIGAGTY